MEKHENMLRVLIGSASQSKTGFHEEIRHLPILSLKAPITTTADEILIYLFIPPHTIDAGYYGFTLVVRKSIRPSVRFSFPDDNLSKHQWIFTRLVMYIDIVEIWFGIAIGQISSIFDGVICPRYTHIFVFG